MSPQLWTAMAAGFLALVTGLAERVVVFFEDLHAARTRSSSNHRTQATEKPPQHRSQRAPLPSWPGRWRHLRTPDRVRDRSTGVGRYRDAQRPRPSGLVSAGWSGAMDQLVDEDPHPLRGHAALASVTTPHLNTPHLKPIGHDMAELAWYEVGSGPGPAAGWVGAGFQQVPRFGSGRRRGIGGPWRRAGPHGVAAPARPEPEPAAR